MKTAVIVVLVLVLLAVIAGFSMQAAHRSAVDQVTSYKSSTYSIDGQKVTLGSSAVYFGSEVRKDLNGDGKEDIAFLITNSPGGSGTFYYLVGAIATTSGYVGTDAVLLGDRIAPQTVESGDGRQVIVNFAERKPGEPFTTRPSVGKSLYLLLDPATMQWGIVDHDFTGDSDLIHVTSPKEGATITSPVKITGEARGTWYFEASFPIVIVDWDGKIIGQGHADAEGDWMTSEFVPFKASITFDTKQIRGPYSKKGTIILKNDNPSGLPQNEKSIEIPVVFK